MLEASLLDDARFLEELAKIEALPPEDTSVFPKPVTVAVLLPAAVKGSNPTLTIVQEDPAGNVAGGSTFVVRASG